MPEDIQSIQRRIKEIESAIAEVKGRLPAHSVKPPIMRQLLDLEDEYDLLQNKLKAASAKDD
jgi:hypothetical protein